VKYWYISYLENGMFSQFSEFSVCISTDFCEEWALRLLFSDTSTMEGIPWHINFDALANIYKNAEVNN